MRAVAPALAPPLAAPAPVAAAAPKLEAAVLGLVAKWSQQQQQLAHAPMVAPTAAPQLPPVVSPWAGVGPWAVLAAPAAAAPNASNGASNVLAVAKLRLAAGRPNRRRRMAPVPLAAGF